MSKLGMLIANNVANMVESKQKKKQYGKKPPKKQEPSNMDKALKSIRKAFQNKE